MPLTQQELTDNYYLATVVYLCDYGVQPYVANDPSTGQPWAFVLVDRCDGNGPFIYSWGITSLAQPSSDLLMSTVDMTMVNSAYSSIYGSLSVKPHPEVKALRAMVAHLSNQVDLLHRERSETKSSALRALTPIPLSRQQNLDSRPSLPDSPHSINEDEDYQLFDINDDHNVIRATPR